MWKSKSHLVYFTSICFISSECLWLHAVSAVLGHFKSRLHTLCPSAQGLVTVALTAQQKLSVAYLYQNHVYSSLSFRTEAVPPLVPFVHFPINLKSRLPEKVLIQRNDTAEQSWGCLLKFTSGHRGSLQPDSSSPPSFPTSLPPLFFSSVASQLLPRHSLTHGSALPLPLCIFHLSQWAANVSSSSSSLDCQGGTIVYDSKTITTLHSNHSLGFMPLRCYI